MFGEWIDAKQPTSNKVKIPKGGSQWFSGVYLGKDTEADKVILGNANGVFRTLRQMKSSLEMRMESSRFALSTGNRRLSNGMRLE